ncbi:hypothetical protein V5N11_011014 [Cardamine amara subsp. amara]|uniref:Retrotransposon Copia-like N-terminal domain-containing protein n=1 Tax=Cardamine amara subsp. amara TaxID=228776 RepID=A0ABD1BVH9_CARAN
MYGGAPDPPTCTMVHVSSTLSPYTLSSSDKPGTLISAVVLNSNNYIEWVKEMRNALHAKRNTCFIDETISRPADDSPDLNNWRTVNSMIIGWIRTSIDSKVKSTVTNFTSAHQLWLDLKQVLIGK